MIVPVAFAIVGIGLLAQNFTSEEAIAAQKLKVNDVANNFVQVCYDALSNDDGSLAICDETLRQKAEETCRQDPSYDICSDGRVEQYYQARQSSSEPKINEVAQPVATPIVDEDWRCGYIVREWSSNGTGTMVNPEFEHARIVTYVLFAQDPDFCLPEAGTGGQYFDFNNPPAQVDEIRMFVDGELQTTYLRQSQE